MGTYTYDPNKPCSGCGGIEYEVNDAANDPTKYRVGVCNNCGAGQSWDSPVTPMSLRSDEGAGLR